MARDCPRDCGCMEDYPSPENSLIYIYSNDGSALVKIFDMWNAPFLGNIQTYYAESAIEEISDYTVPGFYFPYNYLPSVQYARPDGVVGYSTSPYSSTPDIENGYLFIPQQIYTIYEVTATTGNTLDVTYNSTKIIDSFEVTPPVTVTYNGSTIATLNAGDTKTLQCSGKVMASDVVIGDKTLQCNGKLMASDVVIEVVGGVTPTGETWVINETVSMPQTDYMEANFISNNKHFNAIYRDIFGQGQERYFISYSNEMVYEGEVSGGYSYWLDEAYRTVTFETPPTGDLLTWLQANAVKQ